ncbi:MAG: hypothetical protein ABWZ74_05690 [Hyphomicrobiaceae bacterium]|jgi:hypothetical protein
MPLMVTATDTHQEWDQVEKRLDAWMFALVAERLGEDFTAAGH